MSTPQTESSFLEYPNQPELAVAALLHMLTRVADKSSAAVTEAVAAHLEYVAGDERNPPALREAARRMAQDWGVPAHRQLH
jgi:hypothetical protein